MSLKSVFNKAKWYGGVVKDTVVNFGERLGAADLAAGYARAGRPTEMRVILDNSNKRITERKASRRAQKPL